MGFIWAASKLILLGGGVGSIVLPSLIAAGYKDFEGHGFKNNTQETTSSKEWKAATQTSQQSLDRASTTKIGENAIRIGGQYGVSVGKIPWKTKISGKLEGKCKNASVSTIKLGSDKWNPGKTNWRSNKNLYGEIEFECQNKSGTLFLKWEGENNSKKGWYGRVKFQN